MKSKIRSIVVDGQEYTWSVTEIDWDRVLLKVWLKDAKNTPWFTTEKRFNNPWYFIGQVNEENRDKFQFEPVTPKHVAAAIKLVVGTFGIPSGKFSTLRLEIRQDGKVAQC